MATTPLLLFILITCINHSSRFQTITAERNVETIITYTIMYIKSNKYYEGQVRNEYKID